MEDQYEKMLRENAVARLEETLKAADRGEYDIVSIMLTEASKWFSMLHEYRVKNYI